MVYEVTIVRTGVVWVEAESEAAALVLADHVTTDRVNWSDDWSPTDAEECCESEGYDVITEPMFD